MLVAWGLIVWGPLHDVGGSGAMPGEIPTGEIHHLRLTVTDLERQPAVLHQPAGLLGGGGVATRG